MDAVICHFVLGSIGADFRSHAFIEGLDELYIVNVGPPIFYMKDEIGTQDKPEPNNSSEPISTCTAKRKAENVWKMP